MTHEDVLRAIRAALEELSIEAYDEQGAYRADVSLEGIDRAMQAAELAIYNAFPND